MARKIRKVEGYVLGELGEKGKAWGLVALHESF
jgi:hypothetical protein